MYLRQLDGPARIGRAEGEMRLRVQTRVRDINEQVFETIFFCNGYNDRTIANMLKSTDRDLDLERDDVGQGRSRPCFATSFCELRPLFNSQPSKGHHSLWRGVLIGLTMCGRYALGIVRYFSSPVGVYMS